MNALYKVQNRETDSRKRRRRNKMKKARGGKESGRCFFTFVSLGGPKSKKKEKNKNI
jgi:hypothetical protein